MPSYRLTKEWQKIDERFGVIENTTSQNIEVAITSGEAEPLKGGGKLLNGGALFPFHLFENQTIWARAFKIVPSLPVPALAVNSLADLQNREDNPLEGTTDRLTIGISRWYKDSWWPIDWCVTVDGSLWQCTEEHYGSDDFRNEVDKGYWACLLVDSATVTGINVADGKLIVILADGTRKEFVLDAHSAVYDSEGNYISASLVKIKDDMRSEIKQTADSITLTVEKNKGDTDKEISEIRQTVDSITSTVQRYKTESDSEMSEIRQTASDITLTVQQNKSDTDTAMSEIRQTVGSIEQTVRANSAAATSDISKLKQTASQISATVETYNNARVSDIAEVRQTASEISSTVQSNKSALDSEISQIKQTASSLSSTVSSLSSNTQSQITQLSNSINMKVSNGDVVNQINMTSDGTKIDGKHLHITGETVFDSDVTVKGTIAAGAIKKINLDGTLVDALQNTMEGTKDESKWKGIFVGNYNTNGSLVLYSSWVAPEDGEIVIDCMESDDDYNSEDGHDWHYYWPVVKINGVEQVDIKYIPEVNPTIPNSLILTKETSYPETVSRLVKKGDVITTTHFIHQYHSEIEKVEQNFDSNIYGKSYDLIGIFKPFDWNE